jgi:MoxR-like ATPase
MAKKRAQTAAPAKKATRAIKLKRAPRAAKVKKPHGATKGGARLKAIKYTVMHDHRDLVASFDKRTETFVRKLLKLPPLQSFADTLNDAHQQFNPHALLNGSPWEEHRNIADWYQKLLEKLIESLDRPADTITRQQLKNNRENIYDNTLAARTTKQFMDQYVNLASLEKTLCKLLKSTHRKNLFDKVNEQLSIITAAIDKKHAPNTAPQKYQQVPLTKPPIDVLHVLNDAFLIILEASNNHKKSAFGEGLLGPWPLSWYWKAIATTLPLISKWKLYHKKQKQAFVIRISQIRQWILVSVYTEKKKDKAASDETAPERILLRPPLFGPAVRFMTWEQYFSLCIPQFQIKIRQCREEYSRRYSGSTNDHRKHEELYFVLGRHDMIYTFGLPRRKHAASKNPSRKMPITVKLDIDLEPFIARDWEVSELKKKLDLVDDPQILQSARFRYPYDFVSIPIFPNDPLKKPDQKRDKKRDKKPEEQQILLASDAVCRAYQLLSEIWNDATARAVLIIAPPGSGKELLADSNFYFQDFKGRFIKYALSPSSHDQNEHALFSREIQVLYEHNWLNHLIEAKRRGAKTPATIREFEALANVKLENLISIHNETQQWDDDPVEKSKEPPANFRSDGLIFKSRQGILLLDEIDKVPEQTRASLLRLLENDEFPLYETSIVLKLKKWRPLYVFAGSKPKTEMFQLGPKDFWTRISHVVEMAHPLEVDDEDEEKRILRSYFGFFWVKHIQQFFERAEMLPFEVKGELEREFFRSYYGKLFRMLMNYEVIDSIASMFADEISSSVESKEISIRNIRSIVTRALYGLADHILYHNHGASALSSVRNVVANDKYTEKVEMERRNGKRPPDWFELIQLIITNRITAGLSSQRVLEAEYGTVASEILDIEGEFGEGIREAIRQIIRASIFKILRP